MASYTTNYNLKKPADSDSYDIADANGNMDIIDGALNTINSNVTSISNQMMSLNYNANTDRNVESNRTTVMEYLKTNYFDYKYARAMVRYASGYYHGYIFIGEYSGADSLIVEFTNNLTSGEKMIVWRRNSSGTYSKHLAIT